MVAYEAGRRCVSAGIGDNVRLCHRLPAAIGGTRTVRPGHLSENRWPKARGATMGDLQTILTTDLTKLDDEQALQRIGDLIDLAAMLGDENGLNVALSWCDAVQARSLGDTDRALLLYFEANAWSGMSGIREQRGSNMVQWFGPAAECWEKEIVNLRRASNSPGFPKLARIPRCQILTNLGIRLSSLGRFSEAIECFDEALEIDARFGMALGNRGITLSHMLTALPHLPHAPGCCSTTAFHQAARRSLKEACSLTVARRGG